MREIERTFADDVLEAAGWNVKDAERRLPMSDTEKASPATVGESTSGGSSTSNAQGLDEHQRDTIRKALADTARKLLGVPYVYGAEWTDYSKPPVALDCSELTEGVFNINGLRLPDGSQNQYNYCVHSPSPTIGDLAFFGRGGKPDQIYHVGMVYSDTDIIEARGYQPESHFDTGKVILRPITAWIIYPNFIEFRSHPKIS